MFWKSLFLSISGTLGPNMDPIWKFSNFFSKLVISIPKPFQQGVMTIYCEKNSILTHFWPYGATFRSKYGPDMKSFYFFFKICNHHTKSFPSRGHDHIFWKKSIFVHIGHLRPKYGPDMKIFKLFLKISNLHPKTFPTRGHDPIFWKKSFIDHLGHLLGPNMGPIW